MLNIDKLERLEQYAGVLLQDSENQSVRQNFMDQLSSITDFDELLALTMRIAPYAEVVVPMYERLLELHPGDLRLLMQMAYVYWMNGDDEKAEEYLQRAKAVEPEHVEVMRLEATIAREDNEKRRLYSRILMHAPNDRDAFDNLLSFGR